MATPPSDQGIHQGDAVSDASLIYDWAGDQPATRYITTVVLHPDGDTEVWDGVSLDSAQQPQVLVAASPTGRSAGRAHGVLGGASALMRYVANGLAIAGLALATIGLIVATRLLFALLLPLAMGATRLAETLIEALS